MSKVVIITGASRGIGAATAKLLAKQNYRVCINYHKNKAAAEQLVNEIMSDNGEAIAICADVRDEVQVQRMFNHVNAQFGTVTHLVNNAGVLFQQGSLTEISLERFRTVLDINVIGVFNCAKAFINQKSDSGAIVNVSSAAAKTGSPFEYIDYAASKGAIDSLTKGLAMELAGQGIRVNAVRPGFIKTQMHADGGEPNRVERLAPKIPLKRGGTVLEVAEAIAWLLSEKSSYTTGTLLDIAGGK